MSPKMLELAKKKASKSACRFKISAIGFNEKGEYVGTVVNSPRLDKYHGGLHAEMALVRRYKRVLKTIIICRVNKTGGLLPIEPCDKCSKLASKLNITIKSINR